MKLGVGGAILLAIVGLIIAARVFRNRRAAETLQFGKKVAFAYIAAIVLLALWQLWSEGF